MMPKIETARSVAGCIAANSSLGEKVSGYHQNDTKHLRERATHIKVDDVLSKIQPSQSNGGKHNIHYQQLTNHDANKPLGVHFLQLGIRFDAISNGIINTCDLLPWAGRAYSFTDTVGAGRQQLCLLRQRDQAQTVETDAHCLTRNTKMRSHSDSRDAIIMQPAHFFFRHQEASGKLVGKALIGATPTGRIRPTQINEVVLIDVTLRHTLGVVAQLMGTGKPTTHFAVGLAQYDDRVFPSILDDCTGYCGIELGMNNLDAELVSNPYRVNRKTTLTPHGLEQAACCTLRHSVPSYARNGRIKPAVSRKLIPLEILELSAGPSHSSTSHVFMAWRALARVGITEQLATPRQQSHNASVLFNSGTGFGDLNYYRRTSRHAAIFVRTAFVRVFSMTSLGGDTFGYAGYGSAGSPTLLSACHPVWRRMTSKTLLPEAETMPMLSRALSRLFPIAHNIGTAANLAEAQALARLHLARTGHAVRIAPAARGFSVAEVR